MTTHSLTRSGRSFKPEQAMADEEQRVIENADGGEQEEDGAQSEDRGEEVVTQPWGMNDLMQYLLCREEQMGRREE